MSTATDTVSVAPTVKSFALPGWLSLNHAATIFVSAFLLFEVQPLISKFILPWFGGSPAVWTTCMLFFQMLLFGGYAYAHWSTNRLTPKSQAILHLSLLLVAVALLPITPSASWKPTDSADPTWRILMLLGVTVGVPYLVLSTTGPLVQAWFSRAFAGRSPYRLYSLSNIGSLLALLSYPFVIEPTWDVLTQSRIWSALFTLFAVLCGVATVWNWRLGNSTRFAELPQAAAAESSATQYAQPTAWRRLLWLALPACASVTLLATTNHVCQDVAVVPFLWVLPLSLYLLTFIICFDQERWYHPLAFGVATLLFVLAVSNISSVKELIDRVTGHEVNFAGELVFYFGMMFCICMVCHGELVRLRPDPEHLTGFYLMISAGGALGGLFVSLIAPRVFDTFFEWKVALVAAFAIAVAVTFRNLPFWQQAKQLRTGTAFLVALPGFFLIASGQARSTTPIDQARNFYGIVSIWEQDKDDPKSHHFLMRHGRVAHGRQYAAAEKRRQAISYYAPHTGIGRAMKHLHTRDQVRVGTIGLGVGTTATFARPGDVYRFYEINSEVVRQAQNFFTFLRDCEGETEIIMGDARLALEREPPQNYDLLICDAFSGDSIPTHLATQEAFGIYMKHLRPDGMLAVNITNRYIDIFPLIRKMAEHYGLQWTRIYTQSDSDKLLYRTDWMVLTNDQQFLAANPVDVPPEYVSHKEISMWTDHFSNLFEVLK